MISLKKNLHIDHNTHKHKYTASFHPLKVSLLYSGAETNILMYLGSSPILCNSWQPFYIIPVKSFAVAVVCALIFIMPWSKPNTPEKFKVCTQVWTQQLAHLPQTGLYYLLPVLWESPAATSQGGLRSWGAVCAASNLCSKGQGNARLGTNRSSTQGSWGTRWQLPAISLQHDCLWALKLLNVFPALRGMSALSTPQQKPRSPCKRCAVGIRPSRLWLLLQFVCSLIGYNFWHTSVHLIVVTIREQGQIADKEGCIKMHLGAIAVAVFQTASYCTSSREMQALVLYNCATISLNMDSAYKCCVTCWQLCTHKYVLFFRHHPGKEKSGVCILISFAISEQTAARITRKIVSPHGLTSSSKQSTSDL